ncbi:MULTISPECIES: hypothetical protein [unclassified Streptomyces]|uniref:hypothetical protein n=1 Tax=unclassified Streptomyces TaxID=2593676 RepID=UPI002E2DE61E|nr:hypothetical protein [Streptomyces sp. NBC_00223]
MNRAQLTERLRRENVPDALYDIPGVHPATLALDAAYYLRREGGDDGRWVVGMRQRGTDTTMADFLTEAEACGYLYDTITRVPPPVPGGAEQVERVLGDGGAGEIQRRAWEDFHRAEPRTDDTESDDGPATPRG